MEDQEIEDDWQPPDSCWVVLGGGVRFSIDDEEYRNIRNQLPAPGTAKTSAIYIHFTDITGAEVELPYDGYYGMFRSTRQTRARDGLWVEKATNDEKILTRKKY